MDLERVNALMEEWGEPQYRQRQVYEGVMKGLAGGYEQLTPLPAALRRRLADAEPLRQLETVESQRSADGTIKLRFTTRDGFPVEAVAMSHRNRRTVCVSSQSGCPLACTFCATGSMGLGRNLAAGEIAEQVTVLAAMLREEGERVSNVVMMGMGEPFLNYDAVLAACRTLNDPAGFGLGARQIAISTAGWVPGIERLAAEPLQVKLALSLHAPNDQLRTELMPVTRRFPLAKLIAACRGYRAVTRRRIFVEYLMLDGINDSDRLAEQLADLLGRDGFHVNLIAYNPTGSDYRASSSTRVAGFAAVLERPRHLGQLPAVARSGHRCRLRAAGGQGRLRAAPQTGPRPPQRGACRRAARCPPVEFRDGGDGDDAGVGDPAGAAGRSRACHAARADRGAGAGAGRGAGAGDGGRRQLQRRVGVDGAARLDLPLHGLRLPHRRLGRVGHRRARRPGRDPLGAR